MGEDQWDMEVRDMRVIAWGDTTIFRKCNATIKGQLKGLIRKFGGQRKDSLITSHHKKSLISNASLLKRLQYLCIPSIYDTNGIQVTI